MSESGVLKISELLYSVINDVSLTGIISGIIYRESEPINNELENVIILTTGLNSSYFRGVQNGLANINIEIKSNSNGTPKISRFETISNVIRTLLKNNNIHSKGLYFNIFSENLFQEQKQNNTYYYNFKINIQKL